MRWSMIIALIVTIALVGANTSPGRCETDYSGLCERLSWIQQKRFRGGYNYCAPLRYYPEAAQAGLNAIISRLEIGNHRRQDADIDDEFPAGKKPPSTLRCWRLVRPSARAAKDNGLHFFFMVDFAQDSANIRHGFVNNPRRYNNGKRPSPIDDIYWERVIEGRFLRAAKMLQADEYQIDGFFIDSEMYGFAGGTPGDVDYGDFALSKFAKHSDADLPYTEKTISQRKQLISDRGLQDELYKFQFKRLKTMAAKTRRKLHKRVPEALMGLFLWRNKLWFKAVAAGFSTETVPCWVATESTYPGAFDDGFIQRQRQVKQQAGVPILFCPGLRYGYETERVPHRYLKVISGNLYHRAINTAGYWFWALSRLGDEPDRRKPFLHALRRVNSELDRRADAEAEYVSQLQPAPLPLRGSEFLKQVKKQARAWQAVPKAAIGDECPAPTGLLLRGRHDFLIAGRTEDTLSFRVRNIPLGRYTAKTACGLTRPDGSSLPQWTIDLGDEKTINQVLDEDGIWTFSITSHNNAFWVRPQCRSCTLARDGDIHLCGPTKGPAKTNRLFFYVPQGTDSFGVRMSANERETASFRIMNPHGETVFEVKKLSKKIVRRIETGQNCGQVWWLEAEGVEDHSVGLVGIPGTFAARPDQLLVPRL